MSSSNVSYKWVIYAFNPVNGFFEKSISQPENFAVHSLPFELIRELVQGANIIPNAKEGLFKKTRNKKGSRNVLTGLQPLGVSNWYVGDTFYKGKRSVLTAYFTPDNTTLHIFHYSGYDKVNSYERKKFAKAQLPELIKRLEDRNKFLNP